MGTVAYTVDSKARKEHFLNGDCHEFVKDRPKYVALKYKTTALIVALRTTAEVPVCTCMCAYIKILILAHLSSLCFIYVSTPMYIQIQAVLI